MAVSVQLSVPVGIQLSVPDGVQLSVPVAVQLSVPVGVQLSVPVVFSCPCRLCSAVRAGCVQLSVPVVFSCPCCVGVQLSVPVGVQLSVPVGVQLSVPVVVQLSVSVGVQLYVLVGVELSAPVYFSYLCRSTSAVCAGLFQLSVPVYFSCLCRSISAICAGLLQLSVPVPVGFHLSVPVRLGVFTAGRQVFMLQHVHSSQPLGQFTSVHSRVAVSVHLGQVNEKEGSHSWKVSPWRQVCR